MSKVETGPVEAIKNQNIITFYSWPLNYSSVSYKLLFLELNGTKFFMKIHYRIYYSTFCIAHFRNFHSINCRTYLENVSWNSRGQRYNGFFILLQRNFDPIVYILLFLMQDYNLNYASTFCIFLSKKMILVHM